MVTFNHKIVFFLCSIALFPTLAGANEKVTVQLEWKFQFQYAGFIAAKEKGLYSAAGLDVELLEYKEGDNTLDKILSGEVNYGIHNSSLVVRDGKIVPIVLLATYLQQSPLIFVTKPDIKNPAELIGKKVMATSDELLHSSLALMLNHFFITSENTRFLEHSFDASSFISGEVDAMSAFSTNQLFELERKNIPFNILDPVEYGFFMGAVNLFTSLEEAKNHPKRASKFVNATNEGWRYALANKEEIIQIIHEKYSDRKSIEALSYEAIKTESMMLTGFYQIGEVSEELAVRAFRNLQRTNIVSDSETYEFQALDDILDQSATNIKLTTEQRQYLYEKGSLRL